ncbi:hypothetical protein [Haloferax sp. Atlit-4N]|uniref:hypothetical protein n=1 Tax=Haloferax sp. Atlit-4N TaxID=2077206 RepID=UPI0011C042E9|nr:hypothetical protein [Haloferax sp. Atlit-4N]
MSEPTELLEELSSYSEVELKSILSGELGAAYEKPIPGSLRNDLLRACCSRIQPDEDPTAYARTHPLYESSWGTKKTLATNLRMLLSAAGVREQDHPLTSLDKAALRQIITAIRLANEDSLSLTEERPAPTPPARSPSNESSFRDILALDGVTDGEIESWVAAHKPDSAGGFAVYVLDCTPPMDGEKASIRSLRARVSEKQEAGDSLSKMERAAACVTDGERVYYVGYTNDVADRVMRHRAGAAQSGVKFTNTFSPQVLVDVEWFDSEVTARHNERTTASDLTEIGSRFAYWE